MPGDEMAEFAFPSAAEVWRLEGWSREQRLRGLGGRRELGGTEIWQWRCSGHFIAPALSHKRQRCTRTAADHACARKCQNRSKKPERSRARITLLSK